MHPYQYSSSERTAENVSSILSAQETFTTRDIAIALSITAGLFNGAHPPEGAPEGDYKITTRVKHAAIAAAKHTGDSWTPSGKVEGKFDAYDRVHVNEILGRLLLSANGPQRAVRDRYASLGLSPINIREAEALLMIGN